VAGWAPHDTTALLAHAIIARSLVISLITAKAQKTRTEQSTYWKLRWFEFSCWWSSIEFLFARKTTLTALTPKRHQPLTQEKDEFRAG
jgi:hypothetical protein